MSLSATAAVGQGTDVPFLDNAIPALSTRSAAFRRVLALVGVGFFVQTITSSSGGLASLPLRLLLKNHLHLTPTAVSAFATVTGIAWYCKPLAGVFADTIPVHGTRYKGYLLLSAAGAALLWALTAFVPQTYGNLLGMFVLVNLFLMLMSTVLGGYMVTEGQRYRATGRLSSFRMSAMNATAFVSGPISGLLSGIYFGWTAGINTALLIGLLGFFLVALREPPLPKNETKVVRLSTVGAKLKAQYAPLFREKSFWAAVGMTLLVSIMPSAGTPFLYYQTDVLKLSPAFIGNLGAVSGGTSLIGGVVYLLLCRRLSLRSMLALGITLSCCGTLLYLLYHGTGRIIAIEAINGLLATLPAIALFDLAARATPKGGESMAYSLLMAVGNLAYQLGDQGGSFLYDHFHLSFPQLILISTGTTSLTLIAIPFLPKTLVGSPDGAATKHETASAP